MWVYIDYKYINSENQNDIIRFSKAYIICTLYSRYLKIQEWAALNSAVFSGIMWIEPK